MTLPVDVLQEGDDRVEVWDGEDFDPWETLPVGNRVRAALTNRQHKRIDTVIQGEPMKQ